MDELFEINGNVKAHEKLNYIAFLQVYSMVSLWKPLFARHMDMSSSLSKVYITPCDIHHG